MEITHNADDAFKSLKINSKPKVSKKALKLKATLKKKGLLKLTEEDHCYYKNASSFLIYSPSNGKMVIVDKWQVTAFLDNLLPNKFEDGVYSGNSYYLIESELVKRGCEENNEGQENRIFRLDHVPHNEENEQVLMLKEESALISMPLHTSNNPDFFKGGINMGEVPQFQFIKTPPNSEILYILEENKNCLHIFNSKTRNPSDTFTLKYKEGPIFYETSLRWDGERYPQKSSLMERTHIDFFSPCHIILATDNSSVTVYGLKFNIEILALDQIGKKLLNRVQHRVEKLVKGDSDNEIDSITGISAIVREDEERLLLVGTISNHLHLMRYFGGKLETLNVVKTKLAPSHVFSIGPLVDGAYLGVLIQKHGKNCLKICCYGVVDDELLKLKNGYLEKLQRVEEIPKEFWRFGNLLLGKQHPMKEKMRLRFVFGKH